MSVENFEPDQWTNSLVATQYRSTPDTPTRLDLSNLYQWEIRFTQPIMLLGATPITATISFEDPVANPACAKFTLAFAGADPTAISWGGGSLILDSQGSSYPSNIATIWILVDDPSVESLTVWGSRRA